MNPDRPQAGPTPSCDLVLLTWNRVDLLRPCVERIRRHTDLPIRLIVVDNGSTDADALEYLDHLEATDPMEVTIVRRPQNGPIATAINEGLAQARAEWICLLNNDILVTEGWLSEMIAVAASDPRRGLLNPMSNEFGCSPRHREGVDAVAARRRRWRGQWLENAGCAGFCVLLPRGVLERVGTFDEAFQPMYFEDADYSRRVRQAGFLCGVALGTYVYHLGSATIRHDRSRGERFQENERRFFLKWGRTRPLRIAWILTPGTSRIDASEELRNRIRLMANEYHKVWVFCTRQDLRLTPDHLQVVKVILPSVAFLFFTLCRILMKKKRFHRILLSSDDRTPPWLSWLQRIHGTPAEEVGLFGPIAQ